MSQFEKLLGRILSGTADRNLRFDEVRSVLLRLGFSERVEGSHHIYYRADVVEIVNL
jgi:hypothetical protein